MKTTYHVGHKAQVIHMPNGGKMVIMAEDVYRKALKAAARTMRRTEGQDQGSGYRWRERLRFGRLPVAARDRTKPSRLG